MKCKKGELLHATNVNPSHAVQLCIFCFCFAKQEEREKHQLNMKKVGAGISCTVDSCVVGAVREISPGSLRSSSICSALPCEITLTVPG